VALVAGGVILMVGAAVASFSRDPNAFPGDSLRPAWEGEVVQVKQALAAGNLSAAAQRWTDAYGLAVRMRRWEPMAVTGDLAMELSRRDPVAEAFRADARRAYLSALFRARAERSAEGAMRIVASFRTSGDTELVAQAQHIVDQLTRSDPSTKDGKMTATGLSR
jgi:hypothetical protein